MSPVPTIAIIGIGPRGTSLVERIGAHLSETSGGTRADDTPGLELHLVEETTFGAGRIWRTDQTRELCMNTLADAVTLFTEPGSSVAGPVRVGPTLYEWGLLALATATSSASTSSPPTSSAPPAALIDAIAAIPASHAAAVEAHPIRPGFADEYRSELEAFRPESHPSRALYGEYLQWCLERAIAELPAGARVVRHRDRAVGVAPTQTGRQRIELRDGGPIDADAVVLATGWMPSVETAEEREFTAALAERPDLSWVRPASPVEQNLSGVGSGEHVIVRGMGMGFFDTMALLTLGRGGEFVTDTRARGGLRYEPSGREPVLHVTSGRGVPFRAKTLYGSLPPRPEQRFLTGVDWTTAPRPIDFDREFWPRIVADAHFDHYRTLQRVRPSATTATADDVESAITAAIQPHLAATPVANPVSDRDAADADALEAVARNVAGAVAPFIADAADRLDLLGEMRPVRHVFDSAEAFDAWVMGRVSHDLDEAALGRDSAWKAGLWSVSSARGVANRVGSLGGFDAESRASGFAMLMAVGGMAGSGPPAFRNRQLLALAEAGFVRFIGPRARVAISDAGFTAASPCVTDSQVTAATLIDSWMHFHRLADSSDSLALGLVEAGRARPFRISARSGEPRETGAFDIDPATGLLVHADGSLDDAVHIAGIPVDAALHDTVISPMPGTDPPMLRETDRVARSLIAVARQARSGLPPSRGAAPDSPAHPRPLEGAHRV